jgi:hypothetical protein
VWCHNSSHGHIPRRSVASDHKIFLLRKRCIRTYDGYISQRLSKKRCFSPACALSGEKPDLESLSIVHGSILALLYYTDKVFAQEKKERKKEEDTDPDDLASIII